MSRMRKFINSSFWLLLCCAALLPLLSNCTGRLIARKNLAKINNELLDVVWKAKKDIYPPYSIGKDRVPIFQKGTLLRIWIASGVTWIKVRAYPASAPREQARGKTIVFIFEDDLAAEIEKYKDRKIPVNEPLFIMNQPLLAIQELLEKQEQTLKKPGETGR